MTDIQRTLGSRYRVRDGTATLGRPPDWEDLTGWQARPLKTGDVITFQGFLRVGGATPFFDAVIVTADGFEGVLSRDCRCGAVSDAVLVPAGSRMRRSLPKPSRLRYVVAQVVDLKGTVPTPGPAVLLRAPKKPTKS